MIKLRFWDWEVILDYFGLSGWSLNAITSVLIRKKQKSLDTQKRRKQCDHWGRNWSDAAKRKKCWQSPEALKDKVWILRVSGNSAPLWHLDLAQWKWFGALTSKLDGPECEIIHLYCFNPPSWLWFVIAATGNEYRCLHCMKTYKKCFHKLINCWHNWDFTF